MRSALVLCLAARCVAGERAENTPAATSIVIEDSTGAATDPEPLRLDLPAWEPWTTGTTGELDSSSGDTSTGAPTTSGDVTGAPVAQTTGAELSSGSSGDTSGETSGSSGPDDTSSGADSSSTGEPAPACPCEPGADNVCDLPPGACPATMPGGYCDPDGDGAFFDGNWDLGWIEYQAKCG